MTITFCRDKYIIYPYYILCNSRQSQQYEYMIFFLPQYEYTVFLIDIWTFVFCSQKMFLKPRCVWLAVKQLTRMWWIDACVKQLKILFVSIMHAYRNAGPHFPRLLVLEASEPSALAPRLLGHRAPIPLWVVCPQVGGRESNRGLCGRAGNKRNFTLQHWQIN